MIDYLVELTLVWACLLVFYIISTRGRRDWRSQRRLLLFTAISGVLLPALPSISWTAAPAVMALPSDLAAYISPADPPAIYAVASTSVWGLSEWLAAAWLSGAVALLCLLIYRTAMHLRPRPLDHCCHAGFRVVKSVRIRSPYAAFGRIYLPLDMNPGLERVAMLHEAAHLRNGHHYERLFVALCRCVFWFHPLSWLLERTLSNIHEFEADAAVVRDVPPRTYGRQLLATQLAPRAVPALFSSPLKQRIMLLTQSSPRRRLDLRHWSVLILLVSTLLVACSVERVTPAEEFQDAPVYTLAQVQKEADAPKLTGHAAESFLHAIYGTIRYPEEARTRKEIGFVEVALQLSAAGEILNVVTRKPGPSERLQEDNRVVVVGWSDAEGSPKLTESNMLTEEVQRVLAAFDRFEPARVDGRAVPSTIVFGVTFRLEG